MPPTYIQTDEENQYHNDWLTHLLSHNEFPQLARQKPSKHLHRILSDDWSNFVYDFSFAFPTNPAIENERKKEEEKRHTQ